MEASDRSPVRPTSGRRPAEAQHRCTVREKPLIAIVDDDAAVLRSLARLLRVHHLEALGYSSPELLLTEIETMAPDCVIADLAMPGLNGLDLQSMLADCEPRCPIVFLTGVGNVRSSVRAMRAGAVDFLAKPVEEHELLEAIDRALALGRATRELSEALTLFRSRLASLTPRERDVFELVVAGQLNKQIAANLGIAEKTVKVHRARVMRKMAVRSVAGLARIAERIGVSPPLR
ncbi:MAG TPA: response regulator [Pseudomonadales bacterium]